jgi:hypothetical protein
VTTMGRQICGLRIVGNLKMSAGARKPKTFARIATNISTN